MVVPMPTAGPHTAATSGFGKVAMPRRKRNTGDSVPCGGRFRKSPMSLPALNTVSWPCSTATWMSGSRSALSSASAIAPYIAAVIEFLRSSRFKVMVITPRSAWVRISLLMIVVPMLP